MRRSSPSGISTPRRLLAQTALQLIAEGKKQKAINILKKADTEIPAYNVTLDYMSDWDYDLLADEIPGLDLSAFDFDWGLRQPARRCARRGA